MAMMTSTTAVPPPQIYRKCNTGVLMKSTAGLTTKVASMEGLEKMWAVDARFLN